MWYTVLFFDLRANLPRICFHSALFKVRWNQVRLSSYGSQCHPHLRSFLSLRRGEVDPVVRHLCNKWVLPDYSACLSLMLVGTNNINSGEGGQMILNVEYGLRFKEFKQAQKEKRDQIYFAERDRAVLERASVSLISRRLVADVEISIMVACFLYRSMAKKDVWHPTLQTKSYTRQTHSSVSSTDTHDWWISFTFSIF